MLYGLPGSEAESAARASGIRYVAEGFADRAYSPDGSLVPRNVSGAVLEGSKEIVQQAYSLAVTGRIETLCLHGDTLKATEHAREIVEYFQGNGIIVRRPDGK